MIMRNVFLYNEIPDFEKLIFFPLSCHLWSEKYPFFVNAEASVCGVRDKGIFVSFIADEPSPRAVFTNVGDPVYNDSCMEFFFQPFSDDERYINFEINPNGAYLSAVGCDRYDRTFLHKISVCEPEVNAQVYDWGWRAQLLIPEQLISDVFDRDFLVYDTEFIRANCYKCGDLTPQPHYASLFSVDTPEPDFHRPEFFGKLYFNNK